MGIGMCGSSIGGVFWSLVTRVLLSQLGRKWALVTTAFINLLFCAVAIVFLNERTKETDRESVPEKREPIFNWKMFCDPVFTVVYLCSALSAFGYVFQYLEKILDLS